VNFNGVRYWIVITHSRIASGSREVMHDLATPRGCRNGPRDFEQSSPAQCLSPGMHKTQNVIINVVLPLGKLLI